VEAPECIVEGSTVRLRRAGVDLGIARLDRGRLVEYEGAALGATPAEHEAALDALARDLDARARAELAAMEREAFDEDGVDVSLIRWCLSLTPTERLRELDRRRRDIAAGRAALRSRGVYVPDDDGLG